MQRRHFLSLVGVTGIAAMTARSVLAEEAAQTVPATPATIPGSASDYSETRDGIVWFDVAKLPVEGRAWNNEERFRAFDRFPARGEKIVTQGVWGNSRNSAGMAFRFLSDSPTIHVHYRLSSGSVAMPHMPATGKSGLDLYAKDEQGMLRWVDVTQPTGQEATVVLTDGLAPGKREYMLYFPLYNGIDALELGIPVGDVLLEPLPPREEKPMLMYGTSILHGGCAARPGMVHTAILGRRLNQPVLNFGFSGSARMEAPLAELFAELDPSVYVIDALPNMDPQLVRERAVPFVQIIRAKRPETPIILVEDRTFTNAWVHPDKLSFHAENHKALREAYDKLTADGMRKLWYISGDTLFGDDHDGAVDGSHATDLGFFRQANIMEPVLRETLGL